MRRLSTGFLQDLQTGLLAGLLARVKGDATLDLHIRKNYINVYYRGGCILKAQETGPGRYDFHFDVKYLNFPGAPPSPIAPLTHVASAQACADWLLHLPLVKDCMDRWFTLVKGCREREVQQIVVYENNIGVAVGTDYFACDIEYASSHGRADVIAVRWPSEGPSRKRASGHRLTFVEIKYGDESLSGSSGLVAHVQDADQLAANPATLSDLKAEMVGLFRQKHQLGLIVNKHPLSSFSDERPEMLLVIANHDPASDRLDRALGGLVQQPPSHLDLRVAIASLFGYGLFDEDFVTPEEFLRRRGRGLSAAASGAPTTLSP